MSTLDLGRLGGRTPSLAHLLGHFRNRRAVRHLRSLDDHLLDDIGLTRAEIDEAVSSGRI